MLINRGLRITTVLLLLIFALDSPRLVSAGVGSEALKLAIGKLKSLISHSSASAGPPPVQALPNFLKGKSSVPPNSPPPKPNNAPSPSPNSAEGEENCRYVVTIETTCSKDAGTSDPVTLRFGDSSSVDIIVKPLSNRLVQWVDASNPNASDVASINKPFQACSVDEFQIDGPCVNTTICFLYLQLKGSDNWQPVFARIRVQDKPDLDSDYFYFRRYLPRGTWLGSDFCDREVTPFGIKRKRRV